MYSVKANGNYNIIINDIGVTVSSSNPKGVEIEKTIFESSIDAKNLLENKFIIVEELKKNVKESKVETKVEAKKETKVEAKKENAEVFVARESKEEKSKDIFVADAPKDEVVTDTKSEAKTKDVLEVIEVQTVEKAEVEVEVVPNAPAKKVEDKKVEDKKTTTKAPAKKEVTKRTNNKENK